MNRKPNKTGFPSAFAFLLILTACGGGAQVPLTEGSEGLWTMAGNRCIREVIADDGSVMRVINRVDPELCGREAKNRSRNYVRVVPTGIMKKN